MSELITSQPHIAIVGGGIAGSTVALHLSELGAKVTLIEQGETLVNGPPICHLHAGGNLYREISQNQCIDLLKQSIETVRLYPHALNVRPTVIATPESDNGSPSDLIPRLEVIQQEYRELVKSDPANQVLGAPENYYRLYQRVDLEKLQCLSQPNTPETTDDWLIPFAKKVDLNALKYPVVAVQEFGLSVFRLAASVSIALEDFETCDVLTGYQVLAAERIQKAWSLTIQSRDGEQLNLKADFLVNAGGYRTGLIDDMTNQPQQRLVEFKSAFITRWPDCDMNWPEVIFHGERGTPQGMAQLTPYADGYFQLHGMTKQITLFEDGLAATDSASSQPDLPAQLKKKITHGWSQEVIQQRTELAIKHVSRFISEFDTAIPGGKPLYGAQQIPGSDPSLRAADVSFTDNSYARVEIVKASSAYQAANKIAKKFAIKTKAISIEEMHPVISAVSFAEVEQKGRQIAESRGYPPSLAKKYSSS